MTLHIYPCKEESIPSCGYCHEASQRASLLQGSPLMPWKAWQHSSRTSREGEKRRSSQLQCFQHPRCCNLGRWSFGSPSFDGGTLPFRSWRHVMRAYQQGLCLRTQRNGRCTHLSQNWQDARGCVYLSHKTASLFTLQVWRHPENVGRPPNWWGDCDMARIRKVRCIAV